MTDADTLPKPTREAGLARLAEFLPHAGRAYAARRNHDLPGHAEVSRLSPWLRHRLVTEAEVMEAVIARHGAEAAEKFLQEVLWRSYWKGWLELRPGVWQTYRQGLAAAINRVQAEAGLRTTWEAACNGQTGIEGFDDWAHELAATGYLHNHARMWFASIWVFTLRLPWELGADFFLRHLLDGDPASNTLSWRWVAGLQTAGKTYLARPENIAQFTGGRYRPVGLAADAPAPRIENHPAPRALPLSGTVASEQRTAFLLHDEDLSPEFLFDRGLAPVATALIAQPEGRSPLTVAPAVVGFVRGAAEDAARRWAPRLGVLRGLDADPAPLAVADWVVQQGAERVVAAYAPVGPTAQTLREIETALAKAGIPLVRVMRDEDAAHWPLATHGFFRFWEAVRP